MGIKRAGKTVLWRCRIPEDVAVRLELLLADPVRKQRCIYGARSALVSRLLTQYLNELEVKAKTYIEPQHNNH